MRTVNNHPTKPFTKPTRGLQLSSGGPRCLWRPSGANSKCLSRRFAMFLQDGAPCHRAKIVTKWFSERPHIQLITISWLNNKKIVSWFWLSHRKRNLQQIFGSFCHNNSNFVGLMHFLLKSTNLKWWGEEAKRPNLWLLRSVRKNNWKVERVGRISGLGGHMFASSKVQQIWYNCSSGV